MSKTAIRECDGLPEPDAGHSLHDLFVCFSYCCSLARRWRVAQWHPDILPSQSKSTRTLAATGPRALRGTLRVLVSLNQGVGGAGWWTWATTVWSCRIHILCQQKSKEVYNKHDDNTCPSQLQFSDVRKTRSYTIWEEMGAFWFCIYNHLINLPTL